MTDDITPAHSGAKGRFDDQERSFSELIECAPYVIYVVDERMRITSMNERSRTGAFANVRPVIGRDLGEALRVLWSEDVTNEIVARFRETLETGKPYHSRDFLNERSDIGTVESYEWEVHRIRLLDGAFGVVCYSYDSTALRSVEQKLRRSQAELEAERVRLQTIIDTIPTGLIMLNDHGAMEIENAEWKRTWAGNAVLNSVVDYDAYKGFRPDTGERIAAEEWPCAISLKQGVRTRDVILDIERFNGSRGTIVVSSAPIRDETGRVTGAVAANMDITELREAQKRLQEADRRKDEFLATLGHELRNPLAPIGNAAALLQHPALTPDKVTRYAQMIERQARSMAVLLDDLLEVSRITTGKLELKKRSVSLASLIEAAIEPVRAALEVKEQSLRVEMDGGEAMLEVDPIRMSQVLTNLLTNAIKYSERGGSIVLRTSAPGAEIIFEVRDSGIGISQEHLPAIFEMFAQVAPSIERSGGGLGIGLAVAKALVEMHGGRIEGTSPGLGKGSIFTVALPRGQVLAPPIATAASRFEPARAMQERVIVADDNVDAAQSLAAVLELDGYSVHIARDGVEALEIAIRIKPVACFLDIGMPRMNGYELAMALRQLEDGHTPLLVATTGWGQTEDKRRSLEAGFDLHMTKPIDLNAASKVVADRMSKGSEPGSV